MFTLRDQGEPSNTTVNLKKVENVQRSILRLCLPVRKNKCPIQVELHTLTRILELVYLPRRLHH